MSTPKLPSDRGTTGRVIDDVRHARHYNNHPSGVECIEISERLPHNIASAFEYVWRCEEKGNPIQDLEKARWRLARERTLAADPTVRYEAGFHAQVRATDALYGDRPPLVSLLGKVMQTSPLGHPIKTFARHVLDIGLAGKAVGCLDLILVAVTDALAHHRMNPVGERQTP